MSGFLNGSANSWNERVAEREAETAASEAGERQDELEATQERRIRDTYGPLYTDAGIRRI